MNIFRIYAKDSRVVVEPVALEVENKTHINTIELARIEWEKLQRSGYPCDVIAVAERDYLATYDAQDFRRT